MLPMTKSALSRGFWGDALFARSRLAAVPSCLVTATALETVLRMIARAERVFVNMASVQCGVRRQLAWLRRVVLARKRHQTTGSGLPLDCNLWKWTRHAFAG